MTLGQYRAGTWLPTIERRVRPTTADGYRRAITRHIVPMLGGAELQAIDAATVARWIAALCDEGLSAKTARNLHGVLSKALADAERVSMARSDAEITPITCSASFTIGTAATADNPACCA